MRHTAKESEIIPQVGGSFCKGSCRDTTSTSSSGTTGWVLGAAPTLEVLTKVPWGLGQGGRLPGSSRSQSVPEKLIQDPHIHAGCPEWLYGGHRARKWQQNQRGLHGATAAQLQRGCSQWLREGGLPLVQKQRPLCAQFQQAGCSSVEVYSETTLFLQAQRHVPLSLFSCPSSSVIYLFFKKALIFLQVD